MIDERGFLHRLARIETRLLPEARQRADQRRLPPACAQLQHQAAEPVAFSLSCPGGDERFFERPCDVAEDEIGARGSSTTNSCIQYSVSMPTGLKIGRAHV